MLSDGEDIVQSNIFPCSPEGEIFCQDVSPPPAVPAVPAVPGDPAKVSVSTPSVGVTEPSSPGPALPVTAATSLPSVLSGEPAVDPTGSDVVDEISKLLASDKVLEEETDGNLEEDSQDLETIGLLEPDRVKQEEAALDDKLTVELRSIVDQIQVCKHQ